MWHAVAATTFDGDLLIRRIIEGVAENQKSESTRCHSRYRWNVLRKSRADDEGGPGSNSHDAPNLGAYCAATIVLNARSGVAH
jgi:hypothetical protein